VQARRVVVATGIGNFAYVPPELKQSIDGRLTHSSQHSDLSGFSGKHIAVLGAGASAFDMADLLTKAGASVQIVTRRQKIEYNEAPVVHRSFLARLGAPRSGLGTGWRSRMSSDLPLVFHALPQRLRLRAVRSHLGPSPCWFVKETIEGRVPVHVGAVIESSDVRDGRVRLALSSDSQGRRHIEVDHVIAATGYRVALSRLNFIEEPTQTRIHKVNDTPVLSRDFESSVSGLYFVGAAAANSFGPLLRFAYGARFAAQRIARHCMVASYKGTHRVEDRLLRQSIP
jgi:thioredoxin reductase